MVWAYVGQILKYNRDARGDAKGRLPPPPADPDQEMPDHLHPTFAWNSPVNHPYNATMCQLIAKSFTASHQQYANDYEDVYVTVYTYVKSLRDVWVLQAYPGSEKALKLQKKLASNTVGTRKHTVRTSLVPPDLKAVLIGRLDAQQSAKYI